MLTINRTMLAVAKIKPVELDYGPHEMVYEQGTPAQFVYVVEKGALFRFQRFSQDRLSIAEFLFPGDGFGFEIDQRYRDNVQTLSSPVTLLAAPRAALLNAAKTDLKFANLLIGASASAAAVAEDHGHRLRVRPATEQVAQFLLEMDSRLSVGGNLELPMRRHHIAYYLGITLETVSRVFSALQQARVIQFLDVSQRQLVIRDRVRLQSLTSDGSDFDYSLKKRTPKTPPPTSRKPELQLAALVH